ncbi:MAG: hypothetical protein FWC62_07165 [Firmicutes bacterium]|nr:hypothetical protein [Bacillota bacterium]
MPDYSGAPAVFLGAITAKGFISTAESVYSAGDGWRVYILKGGPGSGKSTLLGRAAAAPYASGARAFRVPCASDPHSLDAIILPGHRIMLADGTAPHVLEPKHVGMCENLINVGDCWDSEALRNSAPGIMAAMGRNAAQHERAARYIAAAGALLADNYRLALEATDSAKVVKFATALAGRELSGAAPGEGKEMRCFLSAVTPLGPLFFEDTIYQLCPKVYALEDEYGAVARMALATLRAKCLERKLDIITCLCPLFGEEKVDHILIPSLGVAFCTSNRRHPVRAALRRVHARRFTDAQAMHAHKQRLSFNRRAAGDLLSGASDILREAKASHDELEQYYTAAMDFAKADELADKLLARVSAQIEN